MKKVISLFLTLVLMAICSLSAAAEFGYEYEQPNVFTYSYVKVTGTDDYTLTITGYTGTDKDVVIPAELYGYPVTAISMDAFMDNTFIESVKLPNTIKSIGGDLWGLFECGAFKGCSSLKTINIPDSVESIDEDAFAGTAILANQKSSLKYIDKWLIACTDKNISSAKIKKGTVGIAGCTFNECEKLKSVSLPDSLKYICSAAFSNCTALKKIVFPKGLLTAEYYAFGGSGLLSADLPDSLTYLGSSCFSCARDIKSITIPKKITVIPEELALGCYSLEEVKIKGNVEEIKKSAFYSCSKLKSVNLPDSVRRFEFGVFSNCTKIKKLNFGKNIEYIASSAFENVPYITEQKSTVKYAGNWAVDCDENAEKVAIKSGTVGISDDAFYYCRKLKSVTIPKSVKYIGGFYCCNSLVKIVLPSAANDIRERAFDYCDNLSIITLPENITRLRMGILANTSISSIAIPEGVTSIDGDTGGWASRGTFANCTKLNTIYIPSTVENIGKDAFDNCTGIKDVYFAGSKEAWNLIWIKEGNSYLTNARIHYNCPVPSKKVWLPVANVVKSSVNGTKATISWTKSKGASGYIIEHYTNGKWQRIAKVNGKTSCSFNIKSGNEYEYRIKAFGKSGGKTVYSYYTTFKLAA